MQTSAKANHASDALLDRTASPPSAVEVGEWAFRNRTWLPVPLLVVLLFVGAQSTDTPTAMRSGASVVALGLALRLWAVRYIGVVSRTRTLRTGQLIVAGPYAHVRNPLYVGNWLIWTGFVLWSGVLWMLPVAWAAFALQYGAITRWEEALLCNRFPDAVGPYALRTKRWRPTVRAARSASSDASPVHPWSAVLHSERGTLIASVAVAMLMSLGTFVGRV